MKIYNSYGPLFSTKDNMKAWDGLSGKMVQEGVYFDKVVDVFGRDIIELKILY